MLQVHEIRAHKDAYINALKKRGLDASADIEAVLSADETRRATQAKLDETLAQSNTFSKEIGKLFQRESSKKQIC